MNTNRQILIILLILFLVPPVLYANKNVEHNTASPKYSLSDLYKIALEKSEPVNIAKEDLYISKKNRSRAYSVLMPSLAAFGQNVINEDPTISSPDYTAWGLKLSQSFTLNGRELTALGITADEIDQKTHDLNTSKENTLLNVATAYFGVLRANKGLDIAKSNVTRLQKHRDAVSTRLKLGQVTRTALYRAEAELSGAKSDLIKATNTLKLSRATLISLVPVTSNFELIDPVVQLQLPTSEDIRTLIKASLNRRSEVKSLAAAKDISSKYVSIAKSSYWPTFSVAGTYTNTDAEWSGGDSQVDGYEIELGLGFTLFDGGLRRAEVKQARSRERQTDLAFEQASKQIALEIESVYLDLMSQKSVLDSFSDQLKFANENFNSVTRQYQYGISNSVDMMDANDLLVKAERQLADAEFSFKLAQLQFEKSKGTFLKTFIYN